MAISIKSEREIELMKEAGRILALTHEELKKAIKPGITTYEIDKLGEEVIRSYGCIPSFLNYNGYPASICVSVNEEVVHGIPSKTRFLKEGDIVSLDAGVIYEGYHSDAARTYGVGKISPENEHLIAVTKQRFFEALKVAVPGNHIRDIGRAVEQYVLKFGYGIVEDLVGHGVGANLHEDPEIPNSETIKKGPKLKPGMTIAIETTGTYPLPEAQVDRFMMKLSMGQLDTQAKLHVMETFMGEHPLLSLKPVCTAEQIAQMREAARTVTVHPCIREYIVQIVEETGKNQGIMTEVSTRAMLALVRASQCYAAMQGRTYVIPDDVKLLAPCVLAHRLLTYGSTKDNNERMKEIVATVEVPVEDWKQ